MSTTFGDFLTLADENITAVTGNATPVALQAAPAVIGELADLTAVMARCVDAFVMHDQTSDTLDEPARAILDARVGLHHAAARMRAAAEAVNLGREGPACPAVERLSAAARYLSAGHDLLQTHFTPGPFGSRIGSSPWAPTIASRPVNAALIAEIAAHARRLARWALPLASGHPDGRLPVRAQVTVGVSCHWLRVAEASAGAAEAQPGMAAALGVLRAIPANLAPQRRLPGGGESVSELCAGITTTAERLRHLTHLEARRAPHGSHFAAATWQRTAQGTAITSHCTEQILRLMADPTLLESFPPNARVALPHAAEEVARAWQAWRACAHQWDIFITDPRTPLTPVAAEIGDLVLWTGRLAHRDADWTPARSRAGPLRGAAELASTPDALSRVVAALHHITDVVAGIAIRDRDAVRYAAAKGALLVPTRMLPEEYDMPYRYSPAHPSMTDTLMKRYEAAADASTNAVTALDSLTTGLGSLHGEMAVLRSVSRQTMPCIVGADGPGPGLSGMDPRPGHVERALRDLGIREPALLARAIGIDEAAGDLLQETTVRLKRRAALRLSEQDGAVDHHPARLAAQDSPRTIASSASPGVAPSTHHPALRLHRRQRAGL